MMSLRSLFVASLLALTVLAPVATTQDDSDLGGEVTLKLSTGETLKGVLVAVDALTVVIQHPVLGQLAVPRASIMPEESETVEAKSPWSGSFDFSLNGSRGNNQKQDVRAALNARRDTEEAVDSYALSWLQSKAEVRQDNPTPPPAETKKTEKSADRLWGQARREWRLENSKWRPFAQLAADRDDFKDYDYRVTVAAGAAHPIVEQEDQELTGRFGLAETRDFGGEDESWNLEALLAADYRLDISKKQRVTAGVEVYPAIENRPGHRSIARAQYEAEFNEEDPWRLTVGVERFYDSDPAPGDAKMDVNYYVGLGYTF
jgi:putative salt-induced outer membrane protein YdiY